MKKFLLFLFVCFPIYVNAANANTDIIVNNYNECLWFQDSELNTSGTGYFAYCMKAKCQGGVWQSYYLYNKKMLTCSNGNTDYYTYINKSTCFNYTGTCPNENEEKYCGMVVGYDCNKTNNGTVYVSTGSVNTNPTWDVPTVNTSAINSTKNTTITTSPIVTTKQSTTKKTTVRSKTTKPTTTITTTVTTTIAAPKDSNTFLKSLVIEGYSISFNKEILSYDLEIESNVTSLKISADSESDKSLVSVMNNDNINVNNPILIRVIAEDNSVKEYTINLKYKALSDNTSIKNIYIDNHDFNFVDYRDSFDLIINEDEKNVIINIELEDDKALYEVNGNSDLENGSVIEIVVTSESGKRKNYTINIIKDVVVAPKKKKSGSFIVTLIVLIILGGIGYVAFKLIRRFMPAKVDENYDYE